MSSNRIDIIKRDDSAFQLTFTDINGDPIDLTGGIVFFTVKKHKIDTDDDALIVKDIEAADIDNPEDGIVILTLSAEETDIPVGDYYFDVQLKTNEDKISSTYAGRFLVAQDITIRTTIDNGS